MARHYVAVCIHPLCDGFLPNGKECQHNYPHAYSEECEKDCGKLDGPHSCSILYTDDGLRYYDKVTGELEVIFEENQND